MSVKDSNYPNRIAKRSWPSCLLLSTLLFIGVCSAQAAPKAHETIKGSGAAGSVSKPADAAPFVPPSGEFSILLPGEVSTHSMSDQNVHVPTFLARSGTTNYVVTGVNVGPESNAFDQYMLGFVNSLEKQGNMSVAISDTSGEGWTGKLCNFTRNGSERLAAIVAKATGTTVIYSAMIDAPATSDQAKKFFASFIVYPEKAREAHRNDPGAVPSVAYEMGRTVGSIIGPLLVLGLVVFWVKRSSRRKKIETNSQG
jgi:hypothetical protein